MVKVVLGVREKKEREEGIYTIGFSPPAMSGTGGENLALITEWFSPLVLTSTTLKLLVKIFNHRCLQNQR